MARLMNCIPSVKPLNTALVIHFPKKEFSIEELEAANSTIGRGDLIMHLAYRVSLRQVEFFPQSKNKTTLSESENGNPIPFNYRVARDFHSARQVA